MSDKPVTKSRHYRFFQYVGDTPVIPIQSRILFVFIIFILITSFGTNVCSLIISQGQVIQLTNQILANQLSELYTAASNQYQISIYTQDPEASLNAIEQTALHSFDEEKHEVCLGVTKDGNVIFFSANCISEENYSITFRDTDALETMKASLNDSEISPSVTFNLNDGNKYIGVYKYSRDWNAFIIRGQLYSDTWSSLKIVMFWISLAILVVTIAILIVGASMLKNLLGNINRYAETINRAGSASLDFSTPQNKPLIDLKDAPNDDVTYLAASFNDMNAKVQNFVMQFQRFVPENVVRDVYSGAQLRLADGLDGEQQELAILFSDIKSFTSRTEVLQSDIMEALNMHYDSVIKKISANKGIIGSIIGDAVLASFGLPDEKEETSQKEKSLNAIKTAWDITIVTDANRKIIEEDYNRIVSESGTTEALEKVYEAVKVDVGVGIDGGNVFYGNIGSGGRLAATVIGDNVNSASRLEGLTRIYQLPVIVSEWIMKDALKNPQCSEEYEFFEVDTVMVKGKKEGVKIYFPAWKNCSLEKWNYEKMKEAFSEYEKGLSLYYKGSWNEAREHFRSCSKELDCSRVFLERTGRASGPSGEWHGIWEMTTK